MRSEASNNTNDLTNQTQQSNDSTHSSSTLTLAPDEIRTIFLTGLPEDVCVLPFVAIQVAGKGT
jgi:hypothetical protein